ncbi:stage II sporulation protein M [Clostridium polyendosporum]|uniref:Stage II sporulation protein M n=1 Tax=Clostridium polyendosporum TaxID=69208 RepID=A0A919VFA4_9CLOT|nr:stage II sporulation protein M [Clostridium polyendosporum]GIM27932.1 stage II sporulation protein M [Clostridium polyendosporum]
MNTFLDKINENIRDNKILYLTIFTFFTVGVVLGIYTVFYMSDLSRNDLASYFNNFMTVIGEKPIDYKFLLTEALRNNLLLLLGVFVIGLLVVGAPIILILILFKGFLIGFTFSLIINILGTKGIGLALIAVIPQNLIYVPCFIVCSAFSIQLSIVKLKGKINKAHQTKEYMSQYFNLYIVCFFLLILGVFVETYIIPNLIKFIITKIYV